MSEIHSEGMKPGQSEFEKIIPVFEDDVANGVSDIEGFDASNEKASEVETQIESDLGSEEEAKLGSAKENMTLLKDTLETLDVVEEEVDDDFPDYIFEEFDEFGEEISDRSSRLNASVSFSEIRNTNQPMAAEDQLDRNKLIDAIHEAYTAHRKEERKNVVLNKKLVEYFRRKKTSRALHDDDGDMVFQYMNKYRNLLFKLNNIKGQEVILKKQCEQKISELKQEEQTLKDESTKNVNDLNNLLREAGSASQSTKTGAFLSEKIVEKYIRKMNLLREQLSLFRLELLKSQDKVTAVILKTKQLEDLGDGLKVINFEQLRAEIQRLNDKIEERNNELTRLRRRCSSDIHFLAHVREKQYMLSNTILVQEGVLRDARNQEISCRNYLNYIKLERDELRKKLKQMSFDCGLLDKPGQLRDYDRTTENIAKLSDEIEILKVEKDRLVKELKTTTMRTESEADIKTDMQQFSKDQQEELTSMDKRPYPRIKQGIKPVRDVDLSLFRGNWRK